VSRFAVLLDLQQHDILIGQLVHRRSNLPERAAVKKLDSDLALISAQLMPLQARQHELERGQKRLDDEIALVVARRAETDKKLYSGSVSNPKELQSLQADEDSLDRRRRQLEDQELEIMEALEPLEAEIARLTTLHAELEAKGVDLRVAVAEAEATTDAELHQARTERAELATGIDAELIATYDKLRIKVNPAVAKIKNNSCGGCHLLIPSVEIDAIRKQPPDALVNCEQCGCILVR
jgi:predicted  nucleic acid-binding Zn-ribbon protein